MLTLASLCLKHGGFKEEREWRIIHSPNRHPSALVRASIEVIGGVPQTVYKIPLNGRPPPDLAEIDIPHLLDRVIIGPSQYFPAMHQAFVLALGAVGVQNPETRVVISGIPIRT
jgi:hypothetical protein